MKAFKHLSFVGRVAGLVSALKTTAACGMTPIGVTPSEWFAAAPRVRNPGLLRVRGRI